MKLNFNVPLSFCQQIRGIYSSDLLIVCHRSNLGVALKYRFPGNLKLESKLINIIQSILITKIILGNDINRKAQ